MRASENAVIGVAESARSSVIPWGCPVPGPGQEAASLATRGSTGRPLFLLAATAVLAASLRTAKLLAGAFFAEVRVVVFVWVCDNALAGDFSVIVITLQGHVFGDGLHEIRVALRH